MKYTYNAYMEYVSEYGRPEDWEFGVDLLTRHCRDHAETPRCQLCIRPDNQDSLFRKLVKIE